ncbi:hypothetical protein A2634_00085 [Candidatus Amesbacteria bacterium RIFCSPHIGHO2_01_FULL_48_32]|uniref:DUF5678 domain-containing protein n=1 Tax=Candidatus Amesbacteria bacterium RIFCSPLOWO2_01_FULL_48_25 TaxID=1797259 RepID=A0A1F4ZBF9_9BACT|nr:MAG: hypothetical protein A2634_00085 [Candidatus Amesbacteria bacterium RIFCSPHIGHO2_01_FULL_48_32]OGD03207.1 MAG: hypothetical protein A2989_00035 [Candidatus Amesbacteria bacterium RIFCSPLOWO2_01_FULL_48_25]HJZ05540.1 DUF5678 domain-containing protein [Patescibacteria group bacterium]
MGIDWSNLFKRYKNLWVALKDDEKTVIASGRTAKLTWDKARKKGALNPILAHIPGKLISYVGGQR